MVGADPTETIGSFHRVGDDSAGFSAEFDRDIGAVRVRGWGFWNAQVSESFASTVAQVCSASPKGSALLMDMTALKPLREEGQRSFGALLQLFRTLGVGRVAVATASHLTKLQLLRLVAEHGTKDTVEFTTLEANDFTNGMQKERMNR
jgi:hypothetical protein